MEHSSFPTLYQASDAAATRRETHYFRTVKIQLGSAVLAAITGALIGPTEGWPKTALAVLAAVSLGTHLLVTSLMRWLRHDTAWFNCRAVAESTKSLTWRYCMGVEPFQLGLQVQEVDAILIKRLKELLQAEASLGDHLNGPEADQQAISQVMRDFRGLSLADRKSRYVAERLSDQKQWYQRKADYHGRVETGFFVGILVIQILALGLAVLVAAKVAPPFNLTGMFTTIAAALLAWVQARRHGEVKQAYTIAAYELTLIEAGAVHVADDAALQKLVGEGEQAISREHVMWYAKKTGIQRSP